MAREQPRGECAYCGAEVAKGGAARHLAACAKRAEVVRAADAGRAAESLLHLRVEDQHDKRFWLDLEMRASASLETLDTYLRAIWLECCGHLSEFTAGGFGGQKVGMRRKAGDALRPGVVLTHLYDFGTTSYTLVHLTGAREGAPTTRHPIALLARNRPPEVACLKCGSPATMLCMECIVEHDLSGALCEQHAKTHRHRDYGEPFPIANSPRMGMCGYEGPAEPPY